MKLSLIAFLTAWLLLVFATLANSTDAYEASALVGLLPYYLLSLALFCIFLISWKGSLVHLALLAAFYQASVAGLPYLKYPLIYGSVFDTMFHFSLAQAIVNTGHVPDNSAYFGFTTFHSLAAMLSLVSGLPLVVALKVELFLFPALVQLAGFWIAIEVLRRRSTLKLAILGGVIAFTFNFTSGPQVLAAFLVILAMVQVLQFAKTEAPPVNLGFTISLLLLTLAIVITHHQTAFFTIFAFVGIGLLLPVIKNPLKTGASVVQRIELVGLLSLGFAYIWWTYYAGFIDLIKNVFSIITGEPLQFQTTVGRGISYYGPLTWTYRTIVHYAQRGQLLVWTTIGLVASGLTLLLRQDSDTVSTDTHAVIFSCILIYLGVYAFFLFVPFFVIGSDRFFRFISFFSAPFIAIGLESVYSAGLRISRRINVRFMLPLRRPSIQAIASFLLLVFVFVELTSPLLLGEIYAASSTYQYTQITFLSQHVPKSTQLIGHTVILNQFQVYAPNFNTTIIQKTDSVAVLYAVASVGKLPSGSTNTLILLQRIGSAGTYFEAVSDYSNTTWVSPALAELLGSTHVSLLYNSGESFDTYSLPN